MHGLLTAMTNPEWWLGGFALFTVWVWIQWFKARDQPPSSSISESTEDDDGIERALKKRYAGEANEENPNDKWTNPDRWLEQGESHPPGCPDWLESFSHPEEPQQVQPSSDHTDE